MMKTFGKSFFLIAVCSLLIGGASLTFNTASASARGTEDLSEKTQMELARARSATARYHDVAQAEADDYVNFELYESGEGYHYIKWSLLDGTFDPEHPEMLLYSPVPGENRMELAGVEYLIPIAYSSTPPAGFTGDADVWRNNMEGFGLWELNTWIWLHNPNGVFADRNPRVP
jgi:hypothetical protein